MTQVWAGESVRASVLPLPPANTVLGPLASRFQASPAVKVTGVLGLRLDGVAGSRRGRQVINSPDCLRLLHALRSMHDAVVVGIETVICDDPRLTVRTVMGPQPRPIVLDTGLRVRPNAQVTQRRPLVFCGPNAQADDRTDVEAMRVPLGADGRCDLHEVLARLVGLGYRHILVEGGPTVLESFARLRLLDRMILMVSPQLEAVAADEVRFDLAGSDVRRLEEVVRHVFGTDIVVVLERPGGEVSRAAFDGGGRSCALRRVPR